MTESRIKMLPDALINLIAAGEIIERPASVVKELIENSLDAQAGSVDVELTVGGKQRIVVVDDGIGMSREDVRLSLSRHATSKVADKGDLAKIHTLGFRGEALPSIASVSRFSLFSRPRDEDVGTEIRVDGGVVGYVRDAGIPAGTRVIVEDLFYTVPARRKFLKSDRTEYLTAYDIVVKQALSRPDIRFRLSSDGKDTISAPPGSLRSRVSDILGKRVAGAMGEVEAEDAGIRVTGLVSRPDETRSSQSGIHLFVNDRPVRDYAVTAAIMRAYSGLIFGGRYPIAVVFIQLPFGDVDVNVHPTKREVKFKDARGVGGVVYRAVEAAVRELTRVSVWSPPRVGYTSPDGGVRPESRLVSEGRSAWGARSDDLLGAVDRERSASTGQREAVDPGDAPPPDAGPDADVSGMKLLGQAAGTYIVLSDGDGLVLIDQHAAHERVIYERIKAGLSAGTVGSQRLLFPQTLDIDGPDREVIAMYLEDINRIGFEIEEFGGTTLLVSAVPSITRDADVRDLVMGIAEELRSGGSTQGVESRIDGMIKGVACHGSVRAGAELSAREIEALIAEIEKTPRAAHCPHGRPTMIRIRRGEIELRFKRT